MGPATSSAPPGNATTDWPRRFAPLFSPYPTVTTICCLLTCAVHEMYDCRMIFNRFAITLLIGVVGCGAPEHESHPDLSAPADLASAAPDSLLPTVFGGPCDSSGTCGPGLICLPGPNGGSFCSKTCPVAQSKVCPGALPGTAAYCLVTDADSQGDKGCAFLCLLAGKTYSCPGKLICETTDDPPGSGQRLSCRNNLHAVFSTTCRSRWAAGSTGHFSPSPATPHPSGPTFRAPNVDTHKSSCSTANLVFHRRLGQ